MTPNDDPVHDPFAEFAPKPAERSVGDAAATTIGGIVFGALIGWGCAYFWSLDVWIASGIGGAVGGLAGWMSAPARN